MLRWLSCYVFRAHDFAVRCDAEGVFLECEDCGHRSNGWHTGPYEPTAEEPTRLTSRTSFEKVRALLAALGVVLVRRV